MPRKQTAGFAYQYATKILYRIWLLLVSGSRLIALLNLFQCSVSLPKQDAEGLFDLAYGADLDTEAGGVEALHVVLGDDDLLET